jgi:hypothetical protein
MLEEGRGTLFRDAQEYTTPVSAGLAGKLTPCKHPCECSNPCGAAVAYALTISSSQALT